MQTILFGDCPSTVTALRAGLDRLEHACPADRILPLDFEGTTPDSAIAFVVLTPDRERSIEHVGRLRARTSGRLVAVAPAGDVSWVLGAMHAGADDYLDAGSLSDESLAVVLDRTRGASERRRTGQIVSVVSPGGGAGASVVACNLAVAVAESIGPCGLIDLAAWGDQATLLGLRPRYTLADVSANVAKLDGKMFRQSLAEHESGVCLLAAPEGGSERAPLDARTIDRILELARASLSSTIIDVGQATTKPALDVVRTSQRVVLVVQLTFTSIRRAERLLDVWARAGVEHDRILLVANACGRPAELPRQRVSQVLKRDLAIAIPHDPANVCQSTNCGIPLITMAPRSRFGVAMRRIAEVVETRRSAVEAPAVPLRAAEAGTLWERLGIARLPRLAASLLGTV